MRQALSETMVVSLLTHVCPTRSWVNRRPITRISGHIHRSDHNHLTIHDDVIKWKLFPRYWPFVRGIHRSPVNSQHKGQWRGALMSSSICVWINGWVNNRQAGDLRRYRAHYDVIVMQQTVPSTSYRPDSWASERQSPTSAYNGAHEWYWNRTLDY